MKSAWDGAWNGATGERQHGCIAPSNNVHRDKEKRPCVQNPYELSEEWRLVVQSVNGGKILSG